MAATKKLEEMTPDEYADHQTREWSQYTANDRIYIDGVLAFNAGDAVPAGHVGRVVNKNQVTAVTAKTEA